MQTDHLLLVRFCVTIFSMKTQLGAIGQWIFRVLCITGLPGIVLLSGVNVLGAAPDDLVTLGVKFQDDTGIRYVSERLVSREGVPLEIPEMDSVHDIRRVFSRPDAALQRDRISGTARTGSPVPDLTQCFYLRVPENAAAGIVAALNALAAVEYAYRVREYRTQQYPPHEWRTPAESIAAGSPGFQLPPTDDETPDFSIYQDYLFETSPPYMARAWEYPWGKGFRVTVADIEPACNRNHEELIYKLGDGDAVIGGIPSTHADDIQHGTQVAGLLIANPNSRGIKGICHESPMKIHFARYTTDIPDAVDRTQAALASGDIILIEMQVPGPNYPGPDPQDGLVPVEWDPLTRDAVRSATAVGRIIIEAGGNGSENLDDPVYDAVFGPSATDTGAIIVGAGHPEWRDAIVDSNYGERIDLQGWGARVWTTGVGDAPGSPTDPNRFYTHTFNGTSSATAMVAAAAACVQSAAVYRTGAPLSPAELRNLLIDTGYPHTGDRPIGPLPDVGNAIENVPFVELRVDLLLNRDVFTAGDPFILSHRTINPRSTQLLTQYLILQCLDDYFILVCEDGICTVEPWGRFVPIGPGELEETFLSFAWPEGDLGSVAPGTGYAFYLGYTEAFTGSNLVGNYDWVSFGWY